MKTTKGRHGRRRNKKASLFFPSLPLLPGRTSIVWDESAMFSHSKWRQNGKVSMQEMLADNKMCFCFQRRLCTFMRFVIEVELRSLKSTFHSGSCIFLINREKGSLDTRLPSLFFPCVPRHSVKTNGFSLCPGANQMSFEEPWRSNSFEVFQMSRILIFGFE